MLECHLRRLKTAGFPIIDATPTNATDDATRELAEGAGCAVHRGDETDVLSRFADAAFAHDLDVVVRVTSDCPLVDGDLVAVGVRAWQQLADPRAFVSNTLKRTYPRGLDFEVFGAALLHEAARQATTGAEREHVTPYLYANSASGTRHHQVVRADDASRFRLTLDTRADYALLHTLVVDHDAGNMDAEGLISLLEHHPELAVINSSVAQKLLGE